MRKYYHKTIVMRQLFGGYFAYSVQVCGILALLVAVLFRFNIKPDDGYVTNAFKRIIATEETVLIKQKNIYDLFSEIIPLVKSSDEMLYGGVRKQEIAQKGFLSDKQMEEIDMSAKGIKFNNATTYPLDAEKLKNTPLKFSSPAVLIIHTHSSEAYAEMEGARSRDASFNMIHIGSVVAEILKENGIRVIHDTTENDYPAYNGSYNKALGVITRNLAENPDIQVVLDIHRDYTARKNGDTEIQLKPTARVDGKKTSQVMLVVGTDHSGLLHPDWRHNLGFAVKITEEVNKVSPDIMRPINVRKERFNQHKTPGSLIIEVGAASNSLSESENAAKIIAEAIAAVLRKY